MTIDTIVILLISIGVLSVACGVLTIIKKWTRLYQGLWKRPVVIRKYSKLMGINTIEMGLFCILSGLLFSYGVAMRLWIFWIWAAVYLGLWLFCELKYRVK